MRSSPVIGSIWTSHLTRRRPLGNSVPVATRRRGRRTQEERTATMRARLLQATVDCLIDHGYAGTTTTAVVARAGVSRGAILHHFPTKADLVAAGVEYVLEQRNAVF